MAPYCFELGQEKIRSYLLKDRPCQKLRKILKRIWRKLGHVQSSVIMCDDCHFQVTTVETCYIPPLPPIVGKKRPCKARRRGQDEPQLMKKDASKRGPHVHVPQPGL